MIRIDSAAPGRLPGLWCAASRVVRRDGPEEPLPPPEAFAPPRSTLETLKDAPVAAGYRRISWAAGIDPTKHRPSGEALARRILGGRGLPTLHPLVDAYNRASALTLTPLSAYDVDRLALPITVRPALAGEVFHGSGRDPEPIEEDRIVYADDAGRIAGVALWRDSRQTMIRPETRRALLLAVGAAPLDAAVGVEAITVAVRLAGHVGFVAEGGTQVCGPPYDRA